MSRLYFLLALLLINSVALSQDQSISKPAQHPQAPREMGLVPEPTNNIMGWKNPGDIPSLPDKGEFVVQKVMPADCRVVLGFVHSPVDGRPDSWGYNGVVQEYDNSQGYGPDGHWQNVTYEFVKDPGVHVTLADGAGFNYLYLRGGFEGPAYRDVDALDGPGQGTKIAEIKKGTMGEGGDFSHILDFYRLYFPETVKAKKISFFRRNNILSDVSFLRLGQAAVKVKYTGAIDYHAGEVVTDVTALGSDFVRLKANPGEQHPCNFERRFPRPADRLVRLLVENGQGRALPLAAGQQAHFLTPILPSNTPVGAVRVDLILQGAPETNIVTLAVQDPLIGSQELIRFDLKMNKSGKVKCLLDFSDQLTAEGRRFWITIASQNAVMLAPESKFSLLTVNPEVARTEYVAYRLFLLKGYFYVLSEARPWQAKMNVKWLTEYDGKEWGYPLRVRPQLLELFTTVENLNVVDPQNPVAVGQYYNWLTRFDKPALDQKDVPNLAQIDGVPRWALLLNNAVEVIAGIPDWWITHRMMPSGELGGFFSDDTDQFGWWLPGIMLDSQEFGPKVRRIFETVASELLERNLKEGINKGTTDALHAYEEGQNHMAYMPLVCYGDPRYIEWLMTSCKSVEKWIYRTPEGYLKFRVNDFGWETAQKPPDKPAEKVSGNAALLLHSHLTLAWYNHNPHAIGILKDWADPVVSNKLGYGGPSIPFAAYWFTGDPKFLGFPPAEQNGRDKRGNWWARFLPEYVVHGKEARQQPWWKAYVQEISRAYTLGDWAWAVGQDRDTLCKSLEFILYGNPASRGGGAAKFRYIWTEAEMFTDRIFIPIEAIAQPMLGGYTVRNSIWPAYAVSYEDLARDFAALVLEQGKDRLKVVMVNLRAKPRAGAFLVWQLDHGRYELKTGPDANDDGEIDAVESAKTLELARMDRVPVQLPPRKPTIYELRQIEKLDDLYSRADLAMSAEDVVRNGDKLTVTVHNIGGKTAQSVAVAALDVNGKVLAKTSIPSLDAPLDLVPRVASVELPAANAAKIVVDPDNVVPEITRVNNAVVVQ